MIYLDSCALVKLVVTEPESQALEHFLEGRRSEMVSSVLAITEVVRTVRRSCFNAQRKVNVKQETLDRRMEDAEKLLDRIDLISLDLYCFLAAATFDDDPFVGTLDALHLEAARTIGDSLSAFVTYDKQLAGAGQKVGLPVETPTDTGDQADTTDDATQAESSSDS